MNDDRHLARVIERGRLLFIKRAGGVRLTEAERERNLDAYLESL